MIDRISTSKGWIPRNMESVVYVHDAARNISSTIRYKATGRHEKRKLRTSCIEAAHHERVIALQPGVICNSLVDGDPQSCGGSLLRRRRVGNLNCEAVSSGCDGCPGNRPALRIKSEPKRQAAACQTPGVGRRPTARLQSRSVGRVYRTIGQ